MPRIILFTHPGKQINISKRSKNNRIDYCFATNTTGIRFWNRKKHAHFRKFIQHPGTYLSSLSSTPVNSELYFWGEWEPQSEFKLTGQKHNYTLKPHAIHKPFLDINHIGYHNTDPFVFGNHFYYTNCKQKKNKLNQLSHGDMVIFGTMYNIGFAVDTVFIVDSFLTEKQYNQNPHVVPNILRQVTLNLNKLYQNNCNYKLYKGIMYGTRRESNRSIFSFFPCKLTEQGYFERPLLNSTNVNLPNTKNKRVVTDISYTSVEDFWHDMVNDFISKGYKLGIYAKMPVVGSQII